MNYKLSVAQIPGNFIFRFDPTAVCQYHSLQPAISGFPWKNFRNKRRSIEASEKVPIPRESRELARLREGLPVYLTLVFEPGSAIPKRRRGPMRRRSLRFVCDAAANANKSMRAEINDNLMVFILAPFAVWCASLNKAV